MVSIARARECIGRPVIHTSLDLDGKPIRGVVDSISAHGDVRVVSRTDGASLCDPENLTWDNSGLSSDLLDAIRNDTRYRTPQVFYENAEGGLIGYIGSSFEANDDGQDHLLYVVLPDMRRVYQAAQLANPWFPYAIEEALGWAEP